MYHLSPVGHGQKECMDHPFSVAFRSPLINILRQSDKEPAAPQQTELQSHNKKKNPSSKHISSSVEKNNTSQKMEASVEVQEKNNPHCSTAPSFESSKNAVSRPSLSHSFTPSPENKAPVYPESARKGGLEGGGIFRLFLNKNGTVIKLEYKEGTLDNILIQAAQKALCLWRFFGNAPPFVDVPVDFRLQDQTVFSVP